MSKLLINEPPLVLQKTLAVKLGGYAYVNLSH